MSLLDPASISLAEEEEQEEARQILNAECVPTIGANVVIDDETSAMQRSRSGRSEMPSSSVVDNIEEFAHESSSLRFAQPRNSYQVISKTKSISDIHSAPYRVTVDQISDAVYADFIILMTGGEVVPPDDEYRQILDAMVQGDDFTVACDVDDEFLGHLDYVIVHLPSMRVMLTSEQREQVIEAVVARFRNDKHPIGACLQMIQKSYIGFPPIIKLRNVLLDCLNRLLTSGDDDLDYVEPSFDDPDEQAFVAKDIPNDSVLPSAHDLISTAKRKGSTLLNSAIPDNEYDILAQILARKIKVDDVENVVLREAVKARMKGGLLVGEFWTEPNEFLTAGWRIRLRDSGKIVPRISEVDDIWRRCYESMPECTQKQMLLYLEERYVGVNSRLKQRAAAKDILLRGPRVQFPSRPRCIGSKPMQYVQIDMVEMECSEYGDRCYNMALIVTDLYSHFVFGRALAEAPDTSLLVRHLMDIFGAFSPPEAYRTYTNDEVIGHVMSDIEKLFKIEIKNIGHGVMIHADLCASMYKRAAEELGGRERWVEALPFAVIDYNQTPVKCFGDLRISPFEIMFGRRPWRNESIPPWVRNDFCEANDEAEGLNEQNQMDNSLSAAAEMCMIHSTPLPRRPEVEERLANVYLNEMSGNRAKISCILGRYPAKFDEEGRIVDPGTGYLYDVGDCVYLRNFEQQDVFNSRPKRNQNEPRYYRATIVEVDEQNPDFMYRVCYWDDVINVDHLPPDQWPDEGSLSAWVSPYDIAPSTPELARRRNVVRRREMESQCKCGFDFCELVYNPNCPFKLSQTCCQRLKMNCPFHARLKTPQPRELPPPPAPPSHPKNMITPVLKLAAGGERRLLTVPRRVIKSDADHSNSRWVFQDGRFIELFPSSPHTTATLTARDELQGGVHFDYDIAASPVKRRRLQRYLPDRSYGYQTVELYEPKDNLIISSTHELDGLDVDDETIDVASSEHDSTTSLTKVQNQSTFLSREPKSSVDMGSGSVQKIERNPQPEEVPLVRTTKRVSAPPRRLSPS